MKKLIAAVLFAVFLIAAGNAPAEDTVNAPAELVAAAKAEGELIIYGSCEEDYLAAVSDHFYDIYGIKVLYQHLGTAEVSDKITKEAGKPSADIWFGGTNNVFDSIGDKGLLDNSYVPVNACHLTGDAYRDPDGYWYGIYTGILGFIINRDEMARLGLAAPQSWDDLLKPEYKGLIWFSNYRTSGTATLVANLMIRMKGHDEGIRYLVDLDKNIEVYTKAGSGPTKNVGSGECAIAIGFLHNGIMEIADNGYDNLQLVVPSDGTTFEVGPVAIFKGAAHPNAARLFTEYALSPECVSLAARNGAYQFLVLDNAVQPQVAVDFGLDIDTIRDEHIIFTATEDTEQNVNDVMEAIAASGADTGPDRFRVD